MITNLVFQGSGVKGVAYVGALKSLERHIDIHQIKRVAGTSAGAITALFLALGCDVLQIETLILDFDLKRLLDDASKSINTSKKLINSMNKRDESQAKFFSKQPAKSVKIPISTRLINQFGIYEGEYFRLWVAELIAAQVQHLTGGIHHGEHLTFGELHDLSLSFPNKFRDLYVVGANITTQQKAIFNYENIDTRDVIIADAIRISMSIPAIFKPHHIHRCINGERLIDPRRHLYVDGGIFENYPLRCFDSPKYCECFLGALDQGNFINPETLGFWLASFEEKEYHDEGGELPEHEITDAASFARALNKSIIENQDATCNVMRENNERSVCIDHLGISTLSFGLSKNQQLDLMRSGESATENYFMRLNNEKLHMFRNI